MDKNKARKSIDSLIIESGLSYGEVIDVLKLLTVDYLQKGNDLLNNTDIRKIVTGPKN